MQYFCFVKECDDISKMTIKEMYPDFVLVDGLDDLFSVIHGGDDVWFYEVEDLFLGKQECSNACSIYWKIVDTGVNVRFLFNPEMNETEGSNCHCGMCDGKNHFDKYAFYRYKSLNCRKFYNSRRNSLSYLHKGIHYGRPPLHMKETELSRKTKEIISTANKSFGGPLTDKECIELSGASRSSYYLYKKELTEKLKKENNPE